MPDGLPGLGVDQESALSEEHVGTGTFRVDLAALRRKCFRIITLTGWKPRPTSPEDDITTPAGYIVVFIPIAALWYVAYLHIERTAVIMGWK